MTEPGGVQAEGQAEPTVTDAAGEPESTVEPEGEASPTVETTPSAPTGAAPPPAPQRAAASGRPNRRKVREGTVVSSAMDKTAVVAVIERVRHARYAKTVQRTKRIYVHDAENSLTAGDRVRVAETRPISKQKHWRLVEVLERAR